MAWHDHLPALAAPDRASCRPVVHGPNDDDALEALLASGAVREVHDTVLDQLGELAESRDPARRFTPDERAAAAHALLGGRPAHRVGRWVFYPWSGRLVHLLDPEEHRELRTDRNRYKITGPEQAHLGAATIGVVGLSVGQAAAVTLALEGVGGRLRLADFDDLAITNLNRLRAGVHELGLSKCVIAARAIAEIDPYVSVEIVPEGIHEGNLDTFLDGLDLLVEECDDLLVKLLVREGARARRIPVLMDTSDRGLLDVERFDREPDRPILHGLVGDLRASELAGLATKEKVPHVLRILGADTLSPRFAVTLPEIRETVTTWPQLASGVALGGALVADTARRILLGRHTASGRYWVDLEAIVADGAGVLAAPVTLAPPAAPLPESVREEAPLPPVPVAPAPADPVTLDTIRALVAAAILAPTGHNAQPWRFAWDGRSLAIRLDPRRSLPALDFHDGGAFVGLGAAALNLTLAATAAGLRPLAEDLPDPDDPTLAVRLRFERGPVVADPLLPWIGRRVTNRRLGERRPLGTAAQALLADAGADGAVLRLVTDPAGLDEIGACLGVGDRLTWLVRSLHADVVHGLRWDPTEVAAHRDGLDIDSLALAPTERAGLQLLARWENAEALARIGGGRALETSARDAVAASSAIGLLLAPGEGPGAYLQGGRAMQRLWLRAASLGLALHPVTTLPYVFARHAAGELTDWPAPFVDDLTRCETRFRAVLPRESGHAEVLLFRLGFAPGFERRAVRRPVEDVLDLP